MPIDAYYKPEHKQFRLRLNFSKTIAQCQGPEEIPPDFSWL